jgi:phosphatidylinositol kinase/protein kinase (PI-3  family)
MNIRHYARKLSKVCLSLGSSRTSLTWTALRRSADQLLDMVAMMGKESKMPCFSYGVLQATNSMRQRFQLQMSADEAEQFVETDLIGKSLGSYYTRL